jgi:hypothetical protein
MKASALALVLSAAASAAPFGNPSIGPKPYGVLLLASNAGGALKKELIAVRSQLQGVAVESVESEGDVVAIQRAIGRLRSQHVDKIVAVPLELVSESSFMDELRYLFGVSAEPADDRPDRARGGMPPLRSPAKNALVLPSSSNARLKRLTSDVDLVLTDAMDKSPVLAQILADRAKALARQPSKEAVLLAGMAPRSDKRLETWKKSAAAIAESVRVSGGFREAAVIWVRDGVGANQQDKDRTETQATLRRLTTEGAVVAVPLALDGQLIGRLLARQPGFGRYRWNGKGLLGDQRLMEWVRAVSAQASKFPDVRQYKDKG